MPREASAVEPRKTPMRVAKLSCMEKCSAKAEAKKRKRTSPGTSGNGVTVSTVRTWYDGHTLHTKRAASTNEATINYEKWEASKAAKSEQEKLAAVGRRKLERVLKGIKDPKMLLENEAELEVFAKYHGIDFKQLAPEYEAFLRTIMIESSGDTCFFASLPELFKCLLEKCRGYREEQQPVAKVKRRNCFKTMQRTRRDRLWLESQIPQVCEDVLRDYVRKLKEEQRKLLAKMKERPVVYDLPVADPKIVPIRSNETATDYLLRMGIEPSFGLPVTD